MSFGPHEPPGLLLMRVHFPVATWLLFAKQSLDVGRSARIPGPLEGYPPANPGNVRPPPSPAATWTELLLASLLTLALLSLARHYDIEIGTGVFIQIPQRSHDKNNYCTGAPEHPDSGETDAKPKHRKTA